MPKQPTETFESLRAENERHEANATKVKETLSRLEREKSESDKEVEVYARYAGEFGDPPQCCYDAEDVTAIIDRHVDKLRAALETAKVMCKSQEKTANAFFRAAIPSTSMKH